MEILGFRPLDVLQHWHQTVTEIIIQPLLPNVCLNVSSMLRVLCFSPFDLYEQHYCRMLVLNVANISMR